jgi:hypothetical protein
MAWRLRPWHAHLGKREALAMAPNEFEGTVMLVSHGQTQQEGRKRAVQQVPKACLDAK